MDNIFISSAKKDEAVENFVKSKREELEKMIPGFADDEKFNELVLNFYERGIRDGIDFGMARQKQQLMMSAVDVGIDSSKVKIIIVKED